MSCLGCLRAFAIPALAFVSLFVFLHQAAIVNDISFKPVDLGNKVILVTGGTTGIGLETVHALSKWGGSIILPVRDAKKGQAVKAELIKARPDAQVLVYEGVDFNKLSTVKKFALDVNAAGTAIDIIVHNAGMAELMGGEPSSDGIEKTFQVNHIAPHMLTKWLLPSVKRSKSDDKRVVFVSSFAHYGGSVSKDMYSAQSKGGIGAFRRPLGRYDDSKLMNVMSAKHFAAQEKGIAFNAVHPGFVVSELDRQAPWPVNHIVPWVRKRLGRSTEQGAVAQVTVATHPGLRGVSGRYFEDRCIMNLCNTSCLYCDKVTPPGVVPNSAALDNDLVRWLVKETETLGEI